MAHITEAVKQIKDRAPGYSTLEKYHAGDHPLAFATDKFRGAFGTVLKAFADNLMPVVVDAVADRLRIVGFDVGSDNKAEADSVRQAVDDLWRVNRMDRRSGEVHAEAAKTGDAYVVVWPDSQGIPRIWPNKAANITVKYSDEQPGLVEWAAKVWITSAKLVRANLYYPDRIEKWVSRSSVANGGELPDKAEAYVPFVEDGATGQPTVGEPGTLLNEWGTVPVFHFGNNAPVGEFGRSELRDALPIQDALNKAVCDALVGMEFSAFRQRYVVGFEADIDPDTGKPKMPFNPGADRLWTFADSEIKLGEFSAADLQQMVGVQDSYRQEIARITGIPQHFFYLSAGEYPSGEALKTAEARFSAKIGDRQVAFGNVWEDVMRLALQMSTMPDPPQLSAMWTPASPRYEREAVEIAVLKLQAGVSQRQALREIGYTEEKIDRMVTEKGEERKSLGEALLRELNGGDGDETEDMDGDEGEAAQ